MKSARYLGLVALLAVGVPWEFAQTPEAAAPAAPGPAEAAAPAKQGEPAVPASLSPAAAEVVRLGTSGVGDEVILAYIQNSQDLFNLSADDVLYLKDIGLSPEVVSAMLNHDTALRNPPPPSALAATNPPPIAPAPAAPAPTPQMAPVPAVEPAPVAPPEAATAVAPVYVSNPPPEVTYFYSDLAPYGSWVQLDGYGWCWQPTAVVVGRGWRPYCNGGYWVYSDYGWYWNSTYSWGWAPFHYGRWHHHSRCGWVWMPDRVWGPAWVTWRTAGDTCGWAPLPPHSTFDVRFGWCYNNVAVAASFGWNLGSDAFLFVSFGNFSSHNLHHDCLPPARVGPVFHQTTIINNYVVHNNRVEYRGIPVERVSAATRGPVPRVTVHDWSGRPERMPTRGGGSVVYRPRLEAPARPVHMEAQRIDAQHPVVRHTPSGPPRLAPTVASGGSAQAAGGYGHRPALESPKNAPWTSGARLESSQPRYSPPGSVQKPLAAPAGRAPQGSTWTPEVRSATPPQMQPTPSTPSTTPPTPYNRPSQSPSGSRDYRPTPSPQIQPTPRTTPTAPYSRPSQGSSGARDYRPAPSPQIQSSAVAPRPSPTAPPTRAPSTSAWPSSPSPVAPPQFQSSSMASRSSPSIPSGPPALRAPEEWKQGARSAPGYRSDTGLPALGNARAAAQPSPAPTPSAPSHVYQAKGYYQAAEIHSTPSSDRGSSASSSSHATASSSSRATGTGSQGQKGR
jgi:hypothetical protein